MELDEKLTIQVRMNRGPWLLTDSRLDFRLEINQGSLSVDTNH